MIQESSYVLMKNEPRIILKLFLDFSDFELQYSYKFYSYKKRVYLICWKLVLPFKADQFENIGPGKLVGTNK